jgi:hypothetical protein
MTINVHSRAPVDTLDIYWDTESQVDSQGKYRWHALQKGVRLTQLPDKRYIFHAELTDLIPGQTYYFIVGSAKYGFSEEKKFRTLSLEGPLRLIEGGDWEETPEAEALARKAAEYAPDALLLGGDYPSHALEWVDYREWDAWLDVCTRQMQTPDGRLIPMILAIGNHEVKGGFGQTSSEVTFFFHYFKQDPSGKSYFARHLGKDLLLVVLDSGHTAAHDGEQKLWLENTLQQYAQMPIKFALYHVPLYPSVRFAEKDFFYHLLYKTLELRNEKDVADRIYNPYSQLAREHWGPLFDQYHITAAFEHHDQALKRTYPLKDGQFHPEGTVYLGDGGWGPQLQYPVVQSYFRDYFAQAIAKVHFFWLIDIKEGQITFQAISATGEVYDTYLKRY